MTQPDQPQPSRDAWQHAAAASLIMARLGGLPGPDLSGPEAIDMVPALVDVVAATLTELLADQAAEYATGLAMDLLGGALLTLPPLKSEPVQI